MRPHVGAYENVAADLGSKLSELGDVLKSGYNADFVAERALNG